MISSLIFILVGVIAGAFLYANTAIPIHWTQQEMWWHGFFWSMDGLDKFTLHLGFKPADFLKPFCPFYVEGAYRTRHVSYFFEMLSFKFWQFFGEVYFRNYTLIALHALNAFLIGKVILALTNCRRSAIVGALLFLNSGAALATLLFPFRNAKILVVTFFLLAWLLMLGSEKKFWEERGRFWGFFALVMCGLLTDEFAVFLFPICFLWLWWKEGRHAVFNRRMILMLVATALYFYVLGRMFIYIATVLDPQRTFMADPENLLFQKYARYFAKPLLILRDLWIAFSSYFLRRNFGYWDGSWWGISAAVSFAGLIVLTLWGGLRRKEWGLVGLLFLVMLGKNILVPHIAGYHHAMMPEGVHFPTLLFFEYYYVYLESLITCLVLAVLLPAGLNNSKKFIVALLCTGLISWSNVVHLKNGPSTALSFHNWAPDNRRQLAKNVLQIDQLLKDKSLLPIYLSLPYDNSSVLKDRIGDKVEFVSTHYVPRYLKNIKRHEVLVSFDNIKETAGLTGEDELGLAKTWIDPQRGRTKDLTPLHAAPNVWKTETVEEGGARTKSARIPPGAKRICFFIKGKAYFILTINKTVNRGGQRYGASYELLSFDLPQSVHNKESIASLTIKPATEQKAVFVGPLFEF